MTDTEKKEAEEVLSGLIDGNLRNAVLHMLVNQDVASILAKEDGGYLTAEEICGKTSNQLKPKQLERMLRYAASLGVIKEKGREGVPEFGKSLVTDLLQKSGDAVNAR